MTETSDNKGCFGQLFEMFSPKPEAEAIPVYPFALRDNFLSPAELKFYLALRQAIGKKVVIITKIRLWDIFYVKRPNENKGASNRISQKHVDFLLCNPMTMQPLCGIELDDSSHNKANRQERDIEVDAIFKAANLPLIHFKVQREYNPQEIIRQVQDVLKTQNGD